MEENLVSVIIPTFNREYCIKASVESVLNQTYLNLECIIVDDGSTDNTKAIVESIADDRIRYIYLSGNKGPSYARNAGIEVARGEYIAFNDSDDIWYPWKLEEQMQKLQNTADFGMVYCDYLYKGNDVEFVMPPDTYDISELEGEIFQSLLNSNKIGTPTIIIKRKCMEEIGGFNEELKSLEDWEFVLRVAEKYKIGYVNKTLMQAQYSTSGVNSNIGEQLNTIACILHKHRSKGFSLKQVKKLLFNKLTLINDAQYIRDIRQRIVPEVIPDNEEFDCMLELALETSRLRKLSQVFDRFMQPELFERFVRRNIDKDTDVTAVYGAGIIGIATAQKLLECGIRVECLIDRNKKDNTRFRIVRPKELNGNVTVIISTILNEDISAIQALWERDIRIINIFDMLRYEE